ncbi:MAG: adenylosuccinate synthase [Deltaproteobacteria bacterium]|nr:adenylosuccinate synthase [Deltaproteobacteria bacterium]
MSQITILIGAQWGDEGKGKWIDYLGQDHDIIARFQGGNNAGHTLYVDGEKVVLHQIPSGIFHPGKIAALLSGVVINPAELCKEIQMIAEKVQLNPENFLISEKSHVITPYHIRADQLSESSLNRPIGTTKRGIGPAYTDRSQRSGLLMSEFCNPESRKQWIQARRTESPLFRQSWEEDQNLWKEFESSATMLAPFICPVEARIRRQLSEGTRLLLEGAQGTLLDLSHGTYPYVTSSHTIASGATTSLGIDPRRVQRIIGIAKAYVTRVGEGPFPTELHDEDGRLLSRQGNEFGATTNRPRRCGWLDTVAMRYAAEVNGFDEIFMNKLDILSAFDKISIATHYHHPQLGDINTFPEDSRILSGCVPVFRSLPGWKQELKTEGTFADLPQEAQNFIREAEQLCQVPITMAGVGSGRNDYLKLK